MDHTLGHEVAVGPLPERSGPLTDLRIGAPLLDEHGDEVRAEIDDAR
jgi:hypothetical protein